MTKGRRTIGSSKSKKKFIQKKRHERSQKSNDNKSGKRTNYNDRDIRKKSQRSDVKTKDNLKFSKKNTTK